MDMDIVTLAMYAGIAIVGLFLIKFLIKLPFYIMTFAILGALGYMAYMYLLPVLD